MSSNEEECLKPSEPEIKWFEKYLWRRILLVGSLLVIVQFVFAGYSLVSVLYVKREKLDVGFITFFRGVISAVLSIPIALYFEGKFSLYRYDVKSILYFIFMGSLSAALNPIMYLSVINITSASYTALLSQLIPVLSSILSLIFKVEPLPSIKKPETLIRLAGILVAVIFTSVIIYLGFDLNENNLSWQQWLKGTLLGIFNNFMYSMYLVLQMKLFFCNDTHSLQKKPFTVNCLSMCYGSMAYTVGFIIYAICYRDLSLSEKAVLPIFYSSVLNSAIAYGIIMFCIKHSSAMISSCLFSLQIISSMILLNIFARDKMSYLQYCFTPGVVIGALAVILSPILPEWYILLRKKTLKNKSENEE